MVNNPNKYSEMGTGGSLNDIRDDDDFPHVGIIKALADGLGQNFAVSGFDASSISATSVTIANGKIFRDGKLVDITGDTLTISAGSSGTGNTYALLVAPASGNVTRRLNTVKGKTPSITAGDTIIGVLVHTGSNPMQLQYLTLDKTENSVSIGQNNSSTAYIEEGKITAPTGSSGQGIDIVTTTTNSNIRITPNGNGKIILDGLNWPIADGSADQVLKTSGGGQLSFTDLPSAGISNVVEDTTPQLGGMLDVNGQSIGDGSLELLKFTETASAVNELTITNAATGNGPILEATGDDTNIDLNINTKGTTSSVKINSGMILDNGHITVGNQDSNIALTTTTGTTVGRHLDISAGSTAKGSNNLNGGNLNLKSGGGDGTGTSVITFHTKVDGTDDADERMRIDTLGNLLVGGTGTSSTKLGVVGAVGARAYHGAFTEFTGNGIAGANVLNLDASSMRTILTRSPASHPNPPNEVAIVCPVSTTIEGWECRILCQENAGGADNTFVVTQGSDEVHDITGATIADSSGTTFSLVAGKAYQLICITNNRFILYQIN